MDCAKKKEFSSLSSFLVQGLKIRQVSASVKA